MAKSPHTTFPKSAHVFVKLKDGTNFLDQWESKKGNYVYFRKHERVRTADIKAMTFKRLQSTENKNHPPVVSS